VGLSTDCARSASGHLRGGSANRLAFMVTIERAAEIDTAADEAAERKFGGLI
jgi:hypothetical protein